jgi:hypothetical protein
MLQNPQPIFAAEDLRECHQRGMAFEARELSRCFRRRYDSRPMIDWQSIGGRLVVDR